MFPVDAHVHFHELRAVRPALDAAAVHFRRVDPGAGRLIGALLLTEAAGERVFRQLQVGLAAGDWRLESVAGESCSLIAVRDDEQIAVVCGRQVRTESGLEWLALGTEAELPDGYGLDQTLGMIEEQGAWPVLPWGFGKWLGRRGRDVRRLIDAGETWRFSLGDNGGRPELSAEPALLRQGRSAGYRILPGTDPFPFRGDEQRVGSYGFLLDDAPEPSAPWHSILAAIRGASKGLPPYGERVGLVRFTVSQVRIQLRNRSRAWKAS